MNETRKINSEVNQNIFSRKSPLSFYPYDLNPEAEILKMENWDLTASRTSLDLSEEDDNNEPRYEVVKHDFYCFFHVEFQAQAFIRQYF